MTADLVAYFRDIARGVFPTQELAEQSAYWKAADEIDRLRQTLRAITEIPAGSQGGYSKFKQAQDFAREALRL